jgi:hypothetical protein
MHLAFVCPPLVRKALASTAQPSHLDFMNVDLHALSTVGWATKRQVRVGVAKNVPELLGDNGTRIDARTVEVVMVAEVACEVELAHCVGVIGEGIEC